MGFTRIVRAKESDLPSLHSYDQPVSLSVWRVLASKVGRDECIGCPIDQACWQTMVLGDGQDIPGVLQFGTVEELNGCPFEFVNQRYLRFWLIALNPSN